MACNLNFEVFLDLLGTGEDSIARLLAREKDVPISERVVVGGINVAVEVDDKDIDFVAGREEGAGLSNYRV